MGQKAQSLRPLGSGEMLGDGRMNPAQGLGKELFSSPCRPVKCWRMSVGLPKAAPSLPTASSVRGHPHFPGEPSLTPQGPLGCQAGGKMPKACAGEGK